jgi:hypothetical protein
MSEEHYRLNVRLFLQAAGWVLTKQPEAPGNERWQRSTLTRALCSPAATSNIS